jgi:hypothetical protein
VAQAEKEAYMHEPAFKKKDVELIFVWIIPIIAIAISLCYWYFQGKLAYLGYLYIVPMVFAAIFVNLATGYFNIWHWKTTFFPRFRAVYRPVVYAVYFNLVFILAARLLITTTTAASLLESALIIGFIGMMVGVLFDLFTLDVGFIWVAGRRHDLEKYGTIRVLSRYAFHIFAAMSIANGIAAKAGHYYLYESGAGRIHWLPLGLLAGTAITPPFVVWCFFNPNRNVQSSKEKRAVTSVRQGFCE